MTARTSSPREAAAVRASDVSREIDDTGTTTTERSRCDRLADSNGTGAPTESADLVYRQLRRDLIAVEAAELQRLYDDQAISDTTRRRLQRSLDLEEARLADA